MDTPMPVRPYDAILFDLDGTLIDSAPDIRAAINQVMRRDGLPPLALPVVTSFIGNGVAKLVERAYRHQRAELAAGELELKVARFSEAYAANAATLTRPFPGVIEGLRMLQADGLRLAICTNKPSGLAERILESLGLAPFFDCVIGGDSCANPKPHPAPLFACVDTLGVSPERTVYIGDSQIDVQAARAAGIAVIAVTYGYSSLPATGLGADATIDRVDRWFGTMTARH